MQLSSPATLAPAPLAAGAAPDQVIDQLQHQAAAHPGAGVVFFVAGLLVAVLGYWIASLIVAREESSFVNALKVFGLYFLTAIAWALLYVIVIVVVIATHQPNAVLFVLAGMLILGVALVFMVPMKTYQIGFLRAFAFVVLAAIFSSIGDFALSFVPGNPVPDYREAARQIMALKPEDRQKIWTQFGKRLVVTTAQQATDTLPGELVAGDPSKSFQERQGGLQVMYNELERQRLALKSTDAPAIARYSERKARYEELLQRLKNDVANRSK